MASLFGRAISLIGFPILTHILTPNAYGVAALAFSLISILTVFGVAGQDTSLIRSYHGHQDLDSGTIAQFFQRFCLITGAVFGIAGAVVWLGYNNWSLEDATLITAGILALSVWGEAVSTFSKTIARLRGLYGRLALAQVLAGLSGLALSVGTALIWQANELALVMAGLSPWIVVALLPKLRWKNSPGIGGFKATMHLMKVGLPMILTAMGFWVIASVDRWILSAHVDLKEVGIYSVAATIATLGQIVTTALVSVWNPEVFRNVNQTRLENADRLGQALSLLLFILMTTWFSICMFGGILIQLLASPEFHDAAELVPWISLGYMIYGFNQLFGFGFLIHYKTRFLPWFWGAGVALSLGLNFTLVPTLHTQGAIIAQFCAFTIITSLTWIVGRRWTNCQPHWPSLIIVFGTYLLITLILSQTAVPTNLFYTVLMRATIAIVGIAFAGWIVLRNLGSEGLLDLLLLKKRTP